MTLKFILSLDTTLKSKKKSTRGFRTSRSSPTSSDEDVSPDADDPLTDKEKTEKYEEEKETELEPKRKDGFDGKIEVGEWYVQSHVHLFTCSLFYVQLRVRAYSKAYFDIALTYTYLTFNGLLLKIMKCLLVVGASVAIAVLFHQRMLLL